MFPKRGVQLRPLLAAVVIVSFLVYFLRAGRTTNHLKSVPEISDVRLQSSPATEKEKALHQSESSREKALVLSDLRQLCDRTTWTTGLWIQCHSNARPDSEGKKSVHGGLNNVRGRIQSCLRVAIDAGGGVVIPSVARRDAKELKHLGSGQPVSASVFWNMEYMVEALRNECPQLQVRFDLKNITSRIEAPKRHYKEPRYQKGTFRNMAYDLLKEAKVDIKNVSPANPVAIIFGDSYLAWDYEKSLEMATIQHTLFESLRYNQTLLDISTKILGSPQLEDGFIGIHFRGERDWPHSFGDAESQMQAFTEEINSIERGSPNNNRTLYISCGNQTSIQMFRERLEVFGYEVHDKWTLLREDPPMLAKMEELMFDEKAIVEYQMLLNANLFLGPVMSTMSSLIAFARTDDPEPFFPKYIYPGSTKDLGNDGLGLKRWYPKVGIMKGDNRSKLMLVNGDDVMSFLP